jgi:hypothetical protein
MLTLSSPVVFSPAFEMGVLHHTELLQHGQRPVDGGDVHRRHSPLDPAGDRLGGDVSFGTHDFPKDRLALRREPTPSSPKPHHDLADAIHAVTRYCNGVALAEGEPFVTQATAVN